MISERNTEILGEIEKLKLLFIKNKTVEIDQKLTKVKARQNCCVIHRCCSLSCDYCKKLYNSLHYEFICSNVFKNIVKESASEILIDYINKLCKLNDELDFDEICGSDSSDDDMEEVDDVDDKDKKNKNFRCYLSNIQTKCMINDQISVSNNRVIYRITTRKSNAKKALQIPINNDIDRICQKIKYEKTIAADICSFNKKYTNFSGSFDYGDLSAVIYRLAQGIATYAAFGNLSYRDLANRSPLRIRALAMYDDPVNSNDRNVFIPRNTAMINDEGTFCALVGACNAMGATVSTDIVNLDANSNAPIMTTFNDGVLAKGCEKGLRILLSLYERSGFGSVAAYAFTKGIHSILSVVGHTDEGGYLRRVLRRQSFAVPYGGIYNGPEVISSCLPSPARGDKLSFQCMVDGIALITAACAANCDPLQLIEDRFFPTIFTSKECAFRDGRDNEGTDKDALIHSLSIAESCTPFIKNYISELTKLFFLKTDDNAHIAENHFKSCFNSLIGKVDRHLKYKIVAPYYWIEPTTLFKFKDNSLNSVAHGYGVISGVKESNQTISYMGKHQVNMTDSIVSFVTMKYTSARTLGLIMHHYNNKLDGLGNIKIRQASYEQFVLRGSRNESIGHSINNRRDLRDYLWKRGDGGIPAPAEFMYSAGTILVDINHSSYDTEFNIENSNIALPEEFNQDVLIKPTIPRCVGLLDLHEKTQKIMRSITQAAKALNTIRANGHRLGTTGGECFIIGNYIPRLVDNPVAEETFAHHDVHVLETPGPKVPVSGPTSKIVTREEPMKQRVPKGEQSKMSFTVLEKKINIDNKDDVITDGVDIAATPSAI